MPDIHEYVTQAHQLLDTARRRNADAKTNGLQFLNTELEISRTFAEQALAAFSAGDVDKQSKVQRIRFQQKGIPGTCVKVVDVC